ncbi:hypothetical protein C0Q70_17158 [Pomacea canaliculata]|uniref:Secreted protein n=1 Tax=Pomacea canaliculata TaxID=400727 RepID=A0A2T7NRW5_POMCA|nr:hypothetical protein C0Q70_17158 [Pomacea canaliculata]
MRGMRLKFVAGLRLTVICRLSPFPPPLTVTGQVDSTYPPTYPKPFVYTEQLKNKGRTNTNLVDHTMLWLLTTTTTPATPKVQWPYAGNFSGF